MAEGYLSPADLALEEAAARLAERNAALESATSDYQRYAERYPDRKQQLYDAMLAAQEQARRAHMSAQSAHGRHPATVYQGIMADAEGVKAPELSTWQWFAQNPGLLSSVPKTPERRDKDARGDYILTRLAEAAGKAEYPYSFYDEPALAEPAIQASQYASSPDESQAARSPYVYYRPRESQLPGAASLGERVAEMAPQVMASAIGPPGSAIDTAWEVLGRPQHYATGWRAAGQRLGEGDYVGAAGGVLQAFTGPFAPETAVDPKEFHKYMNPVLSDGVNLALDPMWHTGGAARAGRMGRSQGVLDRLAWGQGARTELLDQAGNVLRRLRNTPTNIPAMPVAPQSVGRLLLEAR